MPRINIYGSAFFGVLVLMVIPLQLFSQLSELPASVLSPNAASLGTYGNLPVSFYTGTPIINIPLYEMDCFGHKLPLSLNYNATGVRPDQRAGWLGVGWSLNAGGVITREVKDRIDEDQSSIRTGYYYAHDLLNTGAWNTLDYLREIAQGGSNKTKSSYKDTEPDEFSFHFPGYSGKFYLDHQGNWQVRCNKPVKVHFNNTFLEVPFSTKGTALEAAGYSYPSSFSGFTITTEEGIQYIFGGDTTAIDYSMDFFGQYNDIWTATAWYLTTIRLQNGEKISLNYVRGDFINQMYIAQQFHLGFATVSKGGSLSLNVNCSDNSYDTRVEAGHEGKLIAPVYLK